MERTIEKQLGFSTITIKITELGKDYHMSIYGGQKPHVGCVVLAIPRPSLTGDGSLSVTSSVINVTGHKDEIIIRKLAEALCKKKNCIVSASGGFHMDGILKEQITELMEIVDEIILEL